MKISNKIFLIAVSALLIVGLEGCSSNMIGVREGSDHVSLANTSQVGACQSKGKTIVSVLTVVGFVVRSTEVVEDNLLQIARNNAVDAGADTLVKGESKEFGKRTFEMFKCRP